MIKLIQNNKTLAYLNSKNVRVLQTTDAEFTLQFTTGCKALKTEYLMQSATEVEVDGNRFNIARCEVVKTRGEVTTFSVFAQHKSYKLIEKLFDKYSVSGTVQDHMNTVLGGTDFTFLGTDITDVLSLSVDLTNSRYMLHRLAREFKAKIVFRGNGIGLYRAVGEDLALTLTIDTKVKGITRSQDFEAQTVCYRVEIDTLNMQEFETISINDTLRIVDAELGLDDRRKVVKTEYDPVLKKNVSVEIGDVVEDTFCDDILDLIDENIELPENVITEVIHQQVINVETAHILNAWIKNLFVEYLETNFDSLIPGRPDTVRLYVKVINNEFSFIEAHLDNSQTEPLLISDPNGSGDKINVYYTATGEHPDAYRYFTITNPRNIHKDLTDAEVEAFKVIVKKTVSENTKMKIIFKDVQMSDGTRTVAPVIRLGSGTDPTGMSDRGIGEIFKDVVGICGKQFMEINNSWCGWRLNGVTGTLQYHDPVSCQWIDIINPFIGGIGGVVFHKDKTSFTEQDAKSLATGTNALHVGYASTGAVETGKGTMMHLTGLTFLAAEIGEGTPPVVRYITVLVRVVAYDETSCGGLTVTLVGDNGENHTLKTTVSGTSGVALFNIADANYTITVSGYDASVYECKPRQLVVGGATEQTVHMTLTNKGKPSLDGYELWAWYKMDSASGIMKDYSGNYFDAEIVGNITGTSTNGGYVRCPYDVYVPTNNMAFKTTITTGSDILTYQTLFGNTYSSGLELYIQSGNLIFEVRFGNSYLTCSLPITPNTTYEIITKGGLYSGICELYANGISTSNTTTAKHVKSNYKLCIFGDGSDPTSGQFKGTMTNLEVYRRERRVVEVLECNFLWEQGTLGTTGNIEEEYNRPLSMDRCRQPKSQLFKKLAAGKWYIKVENGRGHYYGVTAWFANGTQQSFGDNGWMTQLEFTLEQGITDVALSVCKQVSVGTPITPSECNPPQIKLVRYE